MLDIFTLIISIAALLSSFYIGKKQYELAQMQAVAQNKTELYLLVQTITLRDASGKQPDKALPAIYIRNIGKEYPLGREVLPPVSSFDGFRYIYLPTDGTTHISLEIDFLDWTSHRWKTKGYADLNDGIWKVTYSPCERSQEKR